MFVQNGNAVLLKFCFGWMVDGAMNRNTGCTLLRPEDRVVVIAAFVHRWRTVNGSILHNTKNQTSTTER